MKKLLIMLMVVAMVSFLFVGCIPVTPPIPDEDEEPAVAVTGVTLDQATLALTIGDTAVTLVATIEPDDATDTSVIWVSSDRTVAIVAAGVVTPLNAGISAITATTVDGGFVATCVVTVTAEEPPAEITEAPVITSVPKADDGYVNAGENTGKITVRGYSIDGSIVKLYFDGKLIGTTVASMTRSGYATFRFRRLDIDLGKDGEKTLYATAQEVGLDVSDPSDPYTFILDTTLPKIETVSFDGRVFEDGDFVLFLSGDEAETVTAEMSEPVELINPDDADVSCDSVKYGLVAEWGVISDVDGQTLTIIPAEGNDYFYGYDEGTFTFKVGLGILQDVAGNENVELEFTLTFVDLTPDE